MFDYQIIHEHQYGQTLYRCKSPTELPLMDTDRMEVLAKFLDIKFEPEKGEFLALVDMNSSESVTLTDEQVKGIMDA